MRYDHDRLECKSPRDPHHWWLKFKDGSEVFWMTSQSHTFPGSAYSPPTQQALEALEGVIGVEIIVRRKRP